jgi:alkanesulfonate monooxygenase SsuD/methylene tetrahydromethanopterin reductase-like flavin-dependent oxidoreductase (luciferase family)
MLWVSEPESVESVSAPYETYSLLGALAVQTEHIGLGAVIGSVERRAPSILAKIVTGIDVISHGRAVLSLGVDVNGDEDSDDAVRLLEAVTVSRLVLEGGAPTFAGRFYSIDGAVNKPAPVEPGGIPIVVFIHGDSDGLRNSIEAVMGTADVIVTDGGADGVRAVQAVIDELSDHEMTRVLNVIGLVETNAFAARPGEAETRTASGIRDAGASGCIIGIPYPWEPSALEAAAHAW